MICSFQPDYPDTFLNSPFLLQRHKFGEEDPEAFCFFFEPECKQRQPHSCFPSTLHTAAFHYTFVAAAALQLEFCFLGRCPWETFFHNFRSDH